MPLGGLALSNHTGFDTATTAPAEFLTAVRTKQEVLVFTDNRPGPEPICRTFATGDAVPAYSTSPRSMSSGVTVDGWEKQRQSTSPLSSRMPELHR